MKGLTRALLKLLSSLPLSLGMVLDMAAPSPKLRLSQFSRGSERGSMADEFLEDYRLSLQDLHKADRIQVW